MIYVLGGGGASLNYKVVGGTSQPTAASENTIWVNTSTAITSHVFSATQPSNPSAGMVWFRVGASSSVAMNVLKKNGLYVYPSSCQQYISGAWVSKTAKTYNGSTWVSWWNGELYDAGNEYTEKTGGWTNFKPLSHAGDGTATKNATNLYVNAPSTSDYWPSIAWGTSELIDLSNFKTLHITASSASGGSGDSATKFGVTDTKDTSSWNDTPQGVFTTGTTTLDISSVNSGYIWFGAASRAAAAKTATVTKIWLS